MGPDRSGALIKSMVADTAIAKGQALIFGTAEDHCTLGSVNDDGFCGFAMEDAASGENVPVQMDGGICAAIAGAGVTKDDFLVIEGSDGRLKTATAAHGNIVAQALRSGVDGDVIPVLPLKRPAVAAEITAADMSLFVSAEQTGTGSSQNVAHGLSGTPSKVLIAPTLLAADLTAGYTATEGTHTSTNVVVTVTSGAKFKVWAML